MTLFSPTSLFKESNFKIMFRESDLPAIEVMVITSSIPGFNISQIDIARPGLADKRPGNLLTFNDLKVSVICDEKLEVYKEIHSYLLATSNPETANYSVDYPIFDAILNLTTNKNNFQHKITFYNAFFKSIGPIGLQSSTTEDTQVTFDLDMAYVYYNFE